MKIQYASDLHLEFRDNSSYLQSNPLEGAGDILVLAGDITLLGKNKYTNNNFFDWCSEHFEQTYIIPGNHEYYEGADLAESIEDFEIMIRSNVRYINNKSIRIGEVELFFTTLWCKIPPTEILPVQIGITDCHRITYKSERFTSNTYNEVFEECIEWLTTAIQESNAKRKIVISHHCPTLRFVDPRFITSNVNSAFCINLDKFIENSDIEYWIFGHTHYNGGSGTYIGNTLMLCNQLGYTKYGENKSFLKGCYIEIK